MCMRDSVLLGKMEHSLGLVFEFSIVVLHLLCFIVMVGFVWLCLTESAMASDVSFLSADNASQKTLIESTTRQSFKTMTRNASGGHMRRQ